MKKFAGKTFALAAVLVLALTVFVSTGSAADVYGHSPKVDVYGHAVSVHPDPFGSIGHPVNVHPDPFQSGSVSSRPDQDVRSTAPKQDVRSTAPDQDVRATAPDQDVRGHASPKAARVRAFKLWGSSWS